jgi:hypothetical protein
VNNRLAILLLLLIATLQPLGAAEGESAPTKLRLEALVGQLDERGAVVSFNAVNAFSADLLEQLDSSIPVRVDYQLQVISKRGFFLPDKDLARTLIRSTATYDLFTRQYTLERSIEHRGRKKRDTPPPTIERFTTESRAEADEWMTTLKNIPVFDPATPLPQEPLYVRAQIELGRRYILFIFPGRIHASAESEIQR